MPASPQNPHRALAVTPRHRHGNQPVWQRLLCLYLALLMVPPPGLVEPTLARVLGQLDVPVPALQLSEKGSRGIRGIPLLARAELGQNVGGIRDSGPAVETTNRPASPSAVAAPRSAEEQIQVVGRSGRKEAGPASVIRAEIAREALADGRERVMVSFTPDPTLQYVAEFRDQLQPTNACDPWRRLAGAPHNGGLIVETNSVPQRFYRLRLIDGVPVGLFALLENDTGSDAQDSITSDPTVTGEVIPSGDDFRLEAVLDDPDGPAIPLITPLNGAQHFRLTSDELDELAGGQLSEGPHTLHLRVTDLVGAILRSFTVPFQLDRTAPALSLELAPESDSLPLGDQETTNRVVTLAAVTEPNLPVELFPLGLMAVADAEGRVAFANLPLDLGANEFIARVVDRACNEALTSLTVIRPRPATACPFPTDFKGWVTVVSPAAAGRVTGSVSAEQCRAVLQEGGSLRVSLEQSFIVPATPSLLTVVYEVPAFDTSGLGRMKDAFEIALVDASGRALTETVQGTTTAGSPTVTVDQVLPANPDAAFNHTEGFPSVAARGVSSEPLSGGLRRVRIDLASLPPGSTARLILRLLNNDGDSGTRVVVHEVDFPVAPGVIAFPGGGVPAFSQIGKAERDGASVQTNTDCDPLPTQFNPPLGAVDLPKAPPDGIYAINKAMNLVRINRETGAVLDVKPLQGLMPNPNPVELYSLVYHPCEGVFYAFLFDGSSQWLLRIDGAGAVEVVRQIGGLSYPLYEGMAYATHLRSLVASQVPVGSSSSISPVVGSMSPSGDFDPIAKVGRDNDFLLYDDTDKILYGWEPNDTGGTWRIDFPGLTTIGLTGTLSSLSAVTHDPQADLFIGIRSGGIVSCTIDEGVISEIRDLFPITGTGGDGPWTAMALVNEATVCPADLSLQIEQPVEGTTHPSGSSIVLSGAALVGGYRTGATTPEGVEVVFGEDVSIVPVGGAQQVDRQQTPESHRARQAFLSRLDGVRTESFELFARGDRPTSLKFGSTTARMSGEGEVWTIMDSGATENGAFPGGGSRVLVLRADGSSLFQVTFDAPQAAFGFFATDIEFNQFGLILVGADGVRRPVTVPVTVPQGSGGAFYVGVVDRSHPFTAVEFQNIGTTGDGFGFDDLTVGTPEQVRTETAPNRLVSVTVNGRPVDSLDEAGVFHSVVEVRSGANRYEVVARDLYGQTATNVVTVLGRDCPVALTALGEVTGGVIPEYHRSGFRDGNRVVYADVALRNTGAFDLRAPLYVGVTRISDPSVQLIGADGRSADGIPYYDFTEALNTGSLNIGSVSAPRTLAFSNPDRLPFTYELVVLAPVNRPPTFTSVPRLEAVVDRPYAYDADATDPDGEAVTFSGPQVPPGAAVDPVTGVLTWTPTEPGSHEVRLKAADPRGALAEQRFLLTAINAPSNRPPVFTSTPVTVARLAFDLTTHPEIMDLGRWNQIQYLTNSQTARASVWQLEDTNTVVRQLVNGDAAIWLGDEILEYGEITATIEGLDDLEGGDDDYFGIAFGFRDKGHFWLIDWKQGPQDSECGVLPGGITLRKFATNDDPSACALVGASPPISEAIVLHTDGQTWDRHRKYTFTVQVALAEFTVRILYGDTQIYTQTVHDAEFGGGRYGVYNHSQSNVRYGPVLRKQFSSQPRSYIYNAHAQDPDFDALTYSLISGPASMTIDAGTGAIRWSPTADQTGTHDVTVAVSDGSDGVAYQTYRICVLPAEGNASPVIVSDPVSGFLPGNPYIYSVQALDGDGDPLTYSLQNAPEGMAINPTGVITWTPTIDFLSLRTVEFSDGEFRPEDWIAETLVAGGGGSASFTRESSGGQPDAFLKSSMSANAAPSPSEESYVFGFYWNVRARYDPRQRGGIHSLGYSANTILLPGHVTQTYTGLAVKQGGQIFVAKYSPGSSREWQLDEFSTLTADSFYLLRVRNFPGYYDESQHPDFTASGAPLEFGVLRDWNTCVGCGAPPISSDGLDNWSVRIVPQPVLTTKLVVSDGRGGVATQALPLLASLPGSIRGFVYWDNDESSQWEHGADLWINGTMRYMVNSRVLAERLPAGRSVAGTWNNRGSVYSIIHGQLQERDQRTGVLRRLLATNLAGIYSGLALDSDKNIFAGEITLDRIVRFNLQNPQVPEPFAQGGGLDGPSGLAIGPNGDLFVVGTYSKDLSRFDQRTGQRISRWSVGGAPTGPLFGPDELMYVADFWGGVQRVDIETGAFSTFVPLGTAGWTVAHGIAFGPDGDLYGTDSPNHRVLRFDGSSGQYRDLFVVGDSSFSPAILQFTKAIVSASTLLEEPPLPEWSVYLDSNANGRRDDAELQTTTDANGRYAFTNLNTGKHVVRVEIKPGWHPTSPFVQRYDVHLGSGETAWNIDFGINQGQSNAQNASPVFISNPPVDGVLGRAYTFQSEAIDPEGDSLAFNLLSGPAGMVCDQDRGTLVWIPTENQLGLHEVTLRVQDGRGGVAVQSWEIIVTPLNSAPLLTGLLPSPAVVGLPYRQLLRAQDAEGSPLTFALAAAAPEGLQLEPVILPGLGMASPSPTAALVSWTPTLSQVGTNLISVTVRDADGMATSQTFAVEVLPSAVNQAPAFVSQPRRQIRLGTPYGYRMEATDPNGDALTFTLVDGPVGLGLTNRVSPEFLPPGVASPDLTQLGQQLLVWTASDQQLGPNPVHLRVADGRGGVAEQEFVLTVVSSLGNGAPVIVSSPSGAATMDQTYATTLVAEDPDDDPVQWRLVSGPLGMSLDFAAGTLRWTPTMDQLGTNRVVVEVRDALQAAATLAWEVDVGCVNRPPQIVSAPPTMAPAGAPYRYAPQATDPDGDTLEWTSEGSLPAGMTLDSRSGVLSWEPDAAQAGPNPVRLKVSDGRGGVGAQDYVVYVSDQRANRNPVISGTPVVGASPGQEYSHLLRASDPDGDTVTVEGLRLPTGASLTLRSAGAGTVEAVLRWVPTEEQMGAQEFILSARDTRGGSAAQRFVVNVRANQPPLITSEPRTDAIPGLAYRYAVVARDPEGDALRYAITRGPNGLQVDDRGRLQWTPGATQTGEHPVTVTVTDAYGASAVQSFTVTVAADTELPQVALELVTGMVNEETGQWAANLGSTAQIRVRATDNVGVTSVSLRVGAQTYPLGGGGVASIPVMTGGLFQVTGEARDAAGNIGTALRPIQFIDPNAGNTVFVRILSPTNETRLQKRVPVVATMTNAVPIVRYAVDYAVAGEVDFNDVGRPGPTWVRLSDVTLPSPQTVLENVTVATFDPLALLNDSYVIRVYAEDVNGAGWYEPALVNVAGDLKFGEFRIEFTDLAVPLAGIPITVGRVYDSRLAAREGDFGHGWSLALQDARIRESVPAGRSFRPGTRVYLTGPDGRRVGFTFDPVIDSVSFFGALFRPRFQADPGVYDRLEVKDEVFSMDGAGSIGGLLEALDPYNPSDYTLVTRDGTRFDYSETSGLRTVTDLNVNRIAYTRDGIFHYAAGAADPDQAIQFVRDARGRITHLVDPAGKRLAYGYDNRGDLRSFTDQSINVTRYAYDSARAHFLTNIIDPFGKPALNLVYDTTGKLSEIRDAVGRPVKQDFDEERNTGTFTDARGNQTIVEFDERGNELTRILPGISTNRFAYDANNNLTNAVNGRGYATNFVYDPAGNVTRITDALNHVTEIAYNQLGKPTAITNALQQVVRLKYDGSGALTAIINHLGFTTQMGRDALGRLTNVVDAVGNTNTFVYEGGCPCGRPGMVINPDGSVRRYEFDAFGREKVVVNELGAETRNEYDDSGRLQWTQDALNHVTRFRYDGPRLSSIVDALGRSTQFRYDEFGRTNQIITAEGGTNFLRHDANGNLTQVIDAVGNVTRFVYDSANRLTNQVDTFGHTNHFAYDAAGNRVLAIDRNGRKRTFAYDAMNRMTNEVWWEGATAVKSITYGFNALGIQTVAADDVAHYDYKYDDLNRLQRVVQTAVAGQPDFTLLYTHTPNGQVETVTDNWGVQVGSKYDNRNRLRTRTWQGPGVDPARVDFGYFADGNRRQTDRYADLAGTQRIGSTSNAYDRAGLTTNITHFGPAGAVLAKYDYERDAAWQIKRWNINGNDSTYGYDRTGQLTNALYSAQPDEAFRYDLNGNRTGGSYATGGNNQLLADGTYTYGYDAEGSMTSRTNITTGAITRYNFDHRNRLTRVLDFDGLGKETQKVEFAYDALNRRLGKTVNGTVQRFVYNNDDSWADLDGSGAVTARYLLGARIDEMIARQRASDGRGWYLTDHLGSVRGVVDGNGVVRVEFDFGAFGQAVARGEAAARDRFLFTGREFDPETGLYFYRARYYDAGNGRFVSEDPIGFAADDLNLYRYSQNLPLQLIDPTGKMSMYAYALIASVSFGALVGAYCYYITENSGRSFLTGIAFAGAAFAIVSAFIDVSVALEINGGIWRGFTGGGATSAGLAWVCLGGGD